MPRERPETPAIAAILPRSLRASRIRAGTVPDQDAFTDALEASIDLGDVNGRPFLNNVSLGVYGTAVQRDSYRDAKARTLLETAAEVLGPSAALPGVRLVDDSGVVHRDPAVILVSNNPYGMNRPGRTGMRPVLDSGRLGVLVLSRPAGPSRRPGHE